MKIFANRTEAARLPEEIERRRRVYLANRLRAKGAIGTFHIDAQVSDAEVVALMRKAKAPGQSEPPENEPAQGTELVGR